MKSSRPRPAPGDWSGILLALDSGGEAVARRTPVVEQGVLTVDDETGDARISVDTPAWFAWVATAMTFRFVSDVGLFTACRERPSHGRGGRYWKAYRRCDGQLH